MCIFMDLCRDISLIKITLIYLASMVIVLEDLEDFQSSQKFFQNNLSSFFSNCVLVTRPTNVDGKFEYDCSVDGVFYQKSCNLISCHGR